MRLLDRPRTTLLLVTAALCAVGIFNHELWTADEPRVAAVGKAMWQTGDFAVPRLNGEPFLEKPPLYWWLQAGIFSVAGRADAGLARLASAIFAFGTIWLTLAMGRRFIGSRAAALGGLVLLTTAMFVRRSHWVIVDNALVFATTGALTFFAIATSRTGRARLPGLLLMYLFLAAAFLAKGVVGLAVPLLGMFVWLLWSRRRRELVSWHVPAGLALVAGLAGLWLWRVSQASGGEGLAEFVIYNQVGRFAPAAGEYTGGHENPVWYYLLAFPVEFLPWTPLLVVALVTLRRRWSGLSEDRREAYRFFLATTAPAFVVLSLAGTKRGLYLLPLYPGLALLVGAWLDREVPAEGWARAFDRVNGWVVAGLGGLLVLGAVGWGVHDGLLWPEAALTAAAAAVLLALLLRDRMGVERTELRARQFAFLAAGIAAALVTALPAVDREKSFVPFTDAVKATVPPGTRLVAVKPDETTLGVLGFYTDYEVEAVRSVADLPALLPRRGPLYVVALAKQDHRRGFEDLRATGLSAEVLLERRVGDRRRMQLIAVGGGAPGESD